MAGLNGDRTFLRFWAASCISLAGTLVTAVVLPILTYQITGSAWQTALLAAIETTPYLAFGLIAGAVADRMNRRRLMWRCELVSAALLGSIPAAYAAGVLTIPQIYVVAAGVATVFVWFDAASFGALPAIIDRDRIASAYARLSGAGSVMQMAAPAVGGLLASTIGPAPAVAVDSVSCLVSAALLMSIRRSFSTADEASGESPTRLLGQVAEGLRFLWRQPVVRALTLLGFGNSVTLGAVIGLLVVDANRQLGLARTSAVIGLLYAAGAAGGFAASVLMPRLMRRFQPLHVAVTSLIVQVVLVAAFALTTSPVGALAGYLGLNAASTILVLNGIIYRQKVTPNRLQGRVNVVARMIAWGGQPAGAILGGAVADAVSVRVALLVGGAGVSVSLVFGVVILLRSRVRSRSAPAPTVAASS